MPDDSRRNAASINRNGARFIFSASALLCVPSDSMMWLRGLPAAFK